MRRSVIEIMRRAFESVVANWPLMLIRVAASIAYIAVTIAAVIAAVIPLALSIGMNKVDLTGASDPADVALSLLSEHWLVILFILAVITVLITLIIAMHSFVEAGSARVYLDAEAAAAAVPVPSRSQLRVFSVDRWLEGGRRRWWTVFWIYNIAWGVASIILLVPLLLIAAAMLLLRDSPEGMAVAGCAGLVILIFILFGVAMITNIWC